MITESRIAELRKVADAATPGPWEVRDGIVQYQTSYTGYVHDKQWVDLGWDAPTREVMCFRSQDAEFIATFNPAQVLELLDVLQSLFERG